MQAGASTRRDAQISLLKQQGGQIRDADVLRGEVVRSEGDVVYKLEESKM